MLDRDQLAKAIRFEGGLNRRLFLKLFGSLKRLAFPSSNGNRCNPP